MPCPTAPLAKLITSMDYRLKGSISLPVTLCNAISLTTHLILGCNSPLRTITNKVVSWDCGGSGSAEPGSESAIWPWARRSGRSRDLPPARDLGYTKMGKEDLGKTLLLQHSWDFGLQQDPALCQRERKELGNPWGILYYTNAPSQHKECAQLVTGLQLGRTSARTLMSGGNNSSFSKHLPKPQDVLCARAGGTDCQARRGGWSVPGEGALGGRGRILLGVGRE